MYICMYCDAIELLFKYMPSEGIRVLFRVDTL